MRSYKILNILCLVVTMQLLGGCIIKDSPAPGCVESIGFPAMGGCNGKTAIVDLEVKQAPDCVAIEVNNCNGGVLEIRNNCTETINLDGLEIAPSSSISLDFKKVESSIVMVEANSNFSQYIPEDDRTIDLAGIVGSQVIQLSFTKTKLLCQ